MQQRSGIIIGADADACSMCRPLQQLYSDNIGVEL
jgi:hypothetical protein